MSWRARLLAMALVLAFLPGREASAHCLARSAIPAADRQQLQSAGADLADWHFYQEFPNQGGDRTAWLVGYSVKGGRGLYIRQAYFSPKKGKWVKILGLSGLMDVYVPYASSGAAQDPNARSTFWDMRDYWQKYRGGAQEGLNKISTNELSPCGGQIEYRSTGAGGTRPLDFDIGYEIGDRDLLWRKLSIGRRGHELMIWASLNAVNYDYIVEYRFLDDGRINFRAAATATNLSSMQFVAHLHTAIWRIDVDLNGGKDDSVALERYEERSGSVEPKARVLREPLRRETGVEWNPREFTALVVSDKNLKNAVGSKTEIVVSGAEKGQVRHVSNDAQEDFSDKDFWVVQSKSREITADRVKTYVNRESTDGQDVAIWMNSPILHVHRNEDGVCVGAKDAYGCPGEGWSGLALAMYGTGITIMPRNLFDGTVFVSAAEKEQLRLEVEQLEGSGGRN